MYKVHKLNRTYEYLIRKRSALIYTRAYLFFYILKISKDNLLLLINSLSVSKHKSIDTGLGGM